MEKFYPLTESDRALIKREMSPGKVFRILFIAMSILAFAIIMLVGAANFYLHIPLAGICLGFVIEAIMNRKHRKDLRTGTKIYEEITVSRKSSEIFHVPGSASIYIPILGELFPRLYNREMSEETRYYIIADGIEYQITEAEFNELEEGGQAAKYLSTVGGNILGFGRLK